MATRKLPSWMLPTRSNEKESYALDSTDAHHIPLKHLTFPGKLIYCYQSDECNELCEEIMEKISGYECVYGFDIEWKISYQKNVYHKTAVLQLCAGHDKCFVFQIIHMTKFPIMLKQLLSTDSIKKVGVGIHGDVQRLYSDFNVNVTGVIDIGDLNNKKCGIYENWSLNGLLINKLQMQLDKESSIRCSNWENMPLSNKQLEYAVLDAYAGWCIYTKLIES